MRPVKGTAPTFLIEPVKLIFWPLIASLHCLRTASPQSFMELAAKSFSVAVVDWEERDTNITSGKQGSAPPFGIRAVTSTPISVKALTSIASPWMPVIGTPLLNAQTV